MKAASIAKWVYNPSRIPKDEFLQRFVARGQEFRLIWRDIGTSVLGKVEQHYLITGQRGMGKTSLMLKLAYEIQNSDELKDWLLPVVFPEELFGVPTLDDLWMKTAEILEETYPQYFEGVQDEVLDHADHPGYAIAYIRSLLAQKGKKLVLFIDNFGDLLDRFPENDIRAMRAVMMAAHDLRMVGGSARVLDHTYSYDKPFFDFFNVVSLKSLDAEQAFEMMRQLAACSANPEEMVALVEARKARIEGIRRLTGGVPRNLMLLFGMIAEDPEQGFLPALEQILDGATPYFKHRVEELGKQQQQILHHVAMAWDAIGTGEIADKMHEDSKKVSAQLRQMLDNDLLERVETGTKNHLYRLKERFFNIWYLMRMAGQRDLARMRWLVEFLKGWLERPELQERLQRIEEVFRKEGQIADANFIREVIERLNTNNADKYTPPDYMVDQKVYSYILQAKSWEEAIEILKTNYSGTEYFRKDYIVFSLIEKATGPQAFDQLSQFLRQNSACITPAHFSEVLHQVKTWKETHELILLAQALEITLDARCYYPLFYLTQSWDVSVNSLKILINHGFVPDLYIFLYMLPVASVNGATTWLYETIKGYHNIPTQGKQSPSDSPKLNEELFQILLFSAPTWEDTLWIWELLRNSIPNPEIDSYNIIIPKAPSWRDAQNILDQMSIQNIKPTLFTFNKLWETCRTFEERVRMTDRLADPIDFDQKFAQFEGKEFMPIQRACWHLWHSRFGEYHEDAVGLFLELRPKEAAATWQEFYLLLLIIKRQRQAAMALFEESPYQLKEVFKPLYYALLKIWGPDKALEVLRMPPEIESTVDEVVAFIREMQEKYRT